MPNDLPPAIIFDMDDTILSDDKAAERCWRQVCREQAHRFRNHCAPDDLLAELRTIRRWFWADPDRIRKYGINLRAARYEILDMAFARFGIADDGLREDLAESYMHLKAAAVELVPGALDTLQALKDSGVRLGLITNGNADGQRAKVVKANLEAYCQPVVIAGEFGLSKPDPQIFRHTLEQLQVSPAEAWMVGDNLYADIGGAQGVGIHGVWVDWRGGGLPENAPAVPDRIIQSVVELHPGTSR